MSAISAIRVSVLIPVYNQTNLLPILLSSLREPALEGSLEVVLIDDGSSEEIDRVLANIHVNFPIRVIRRKRNGGYSAAINTGIIESSGEYLFLLNSDVILVENYIHRLMTLSEKDQAAAVVTGVCIFPQNGRIQNAGIAFSETDHYLLYYWSNPSTLPFSAPTELQAAAFAAVLIPRRIFSLIGFLDEELVNGYDDIDFCFRARSRGLKIILDPDALSYHWERKSRDPLGVRRRDNIARVWERWGKTLKPDLASFVARSAIDLKCRRKDIAVGPHDLVLLGQGAGISVIRDQLVSGASPLEIGSTFDLRRYSGVAKEFLLPLVVPSEISYSDRPLILAVDCIDQLTDNYMWIEARKHYGYTDLAVDLHGNTVALTDI